MEWKLGELKVIGNKVMARCAECGKIVRVDKPLFGSLHLCAPQEKRF